MRSRRQTVKRLLVQAEIQMIKADQFVIPQTVVHHVKKAQSLLSQAAKVMPSVAK